MAPEGAKNHRGRKLEKAIRKEWTPDKGGLPDF
jgi:hypothetical protein